MQYDDMEKDNCGSQHPEDDSINEKVVHATSTNTPQGITAVNIFWF